MEAATRAVSGAVGSEWFNDSNTGVVSEPKKSRTMSGTMPAANVTFSRLEWDQLPDAPHLPGLYAWYLRPTLRKADLGDEAQTRANLVRLAELFKAPDLSVTAAGHLSKKYTGTLRHEPLGSDEVEIAELVDSMLREPASRKFIAHILEAAAPFLTAPLYVGVSDNLYRRLAEHSHYILRNLDQVNPSSGKHTFAREIGRRRISPSELLVYCCAIDEAELPGDHTVRSVTEAAETILNRIFYPILGKR